MPVGGVSAAILALAMGTCLAFSAGQASASPVSCGDTITTDTKLHYDLVNCPNNGIVIGADNVTLDLNGHTIDGDGKPVANCPDPNGLCDIGVVNESRNGFTIEGGKIREFDVAVSVFDARDNRLRDLRGSANSFAALFVGQSTDSRIERNSFANNGTSAIVLVDSSHNRIKRNSATRNGHSSVFLLGSDRNRIEKNLLDRNGDGIETHESARNHFRKNRISHSQGAAITLDDGAIRNRVEKNRITANGDGITSFEGRGNRISRNTITGTGFFGDPESGGFGIILDGADRNIVQKNSVTGGRGEAIFVTSLDSQGTSDRNVVSRNVVNSKLSDGILVSGAATGTLIKRNIANHSGDDGIDVNAAGTKLTRNTANRNHDLGIEAVPGVIDGGGNKAGGNGNPAQCTNVACS
jgi:parallel beta-helix repeat protein